MNDKKLAFIICSNNSLYYEECVWYINMLNVPDGYETDIISISEAESMAQAYNAAMESSDAKYKIYLHQDVFIYNPKFIEDILEIFQSDCQIGMIGMVGGINLPNDANIWDAWNVGCTYGCNTIDAFPIVLYQNPCVKSIEVEAVDGMLMATQYDVKWREDLNLGWDFYDISQSLEFTNNGYKVVIPYQETPWCMHDCGPSNMLHYDEGRKKMLNEYRDRFTEDFAPKYNLDDIHEQEILFSIIKKCIEKRNFEEAVNRLNTMKDKQIKNKNLRYASNLLDIYSSEREIVEENKKFFYNVSTWNELKEKYDRIKFLLRRVENNLDNSALDDILAMLREKKISQEAVKVIVIHSIVYKKDVIDRLLYRYRKQKLENEVVQIKEIILQIEKISFDIDRKFQRGIKQDAEIVKLVVDTMKEVDKIMGIHSQGEWEQFYVNMENNNIPSNYGERMLEWKKEVLDFCQSKIINI